MRVRRPGAAATVALLISGTASSVVVVATATDSTRGHTAALLVGLGAISLTAAGTLLWGRRRGRGGESTATRSVGTHDVSSRAPATGVVERRSFLGHGFSLAAGTLGVATGAVLLPAPAGSTPGPVGKTVTGSSNDESAVDVWDFRELVQDRPDLDDPGSWDWTPALQAAIEAAASRARKSTPLPGEPTAVRRDGLPTVRLRRGVYRTTGTVSLRYLHGFTVQGEGPQATVIEHQGGGPLFDIRRCHALTVERLTVIGRDPTVVGPVQGLVEGSCGFHLEEHSGDTQPAGGNSFQIRFSDLDVQQLHRGFHFVGDQMTDGVMWTNVWMRDNFYDVDYENGQAVNHQMLGGQVAYAVDHEDSAYQARLDQWSSPPDIRDGAVFHVRGGGQVSVFGGSIIARKSTLLFETLPQDGSLGVTTNVLPYLFVGTRWEMRERDSIGDVHGLQRVTMVRYADPFAMPRLRQPSLRFTGCDWLVLNETVDLFYLTNAGTVLLDTCRMWPAGSAQLVSVLDQATAQIPGTYRSVHSTVLPHGRREGGTGPPSTTVDHIVEMRDGPATGTDPAATRQHHHTLVPGIPADARRLIHRGPDGELLAAGATHLEATLLLPAGGNAIIQRVGVVCFDDTSGDDITATFTDGTDQRLYASLVVDSNGNGRFDGRTLSGHAKPYALVEELAGPDGSVHLNLTRNGPLALHGYVYVDYV